MLFLFTLNIKAKMKKLVLNESKVKSLQCYNETLYSQIMNSKEAFFFKQLFILQNRNVFFVHNILGPFILSDFFPQVNKIYFL